MKSLFWCVCVIVTGSLLVVVAAQLPHQTRASAHAPPEGDASPTLVSRVQALESSLKAANERLSSVAVQLKKAEEYSRGINRIDWREVKADEGREYEVDFSPDVPREVTFLIRGIDLSREEHDVSKLYALVENVKIVGTKVKFTCKLNLTDDDNNGAKGPIHLDVFAKLK